MTSPIIDTHAHMYMKPFNKDLDESIARARDAGVIRIINVGIDLETSRESIRLAENYPDIFATVGFHPHDASRMMQEDIEVLAELAGHPKVIAIGEIGLDFYRNRAPREAQFQALEWQLNLASRLCLPIVVHSREADKEMTSALRHWTDSRPSSDEHPVGVIHCFNGTARIVQEYLDMGFYIAIGAYIGYPTSRDLHDAVRRIPSDRLLVETDCPFLPPQAYRGKRNEPSYLPITVKAIAEIRGTSPQDIAEMTTQNAFTAFRLPTDSGRSS